MNSVRTSSLLKQNKVLLPQVITATSVYIEIQKNKKTVVIPDTKKAIMHNYYAPPSSSLLLLLASTQLQPNGKKNADTSTRMQVTPQKLGIAIGTRTGNNWQWEERKVRQKQWRSTQRPRPKKDFVGLMLLPLMMAKMSARRGGGRKKVLES